jgi:hypothetical protein
MACPYIPAFFGYFPQGKINGKPSPEHQTEPGFLESANLRLPWACIQISLDAREGDSDASAMAF